MSQGAKTALSAGAPVATIPNLISLARLAAAPVAVWLVLRADLHAALCLFLLAAASDALDGWLARRSTATRLGAILDPLADKLLLAAMYVVLASVRLLPAWLAAMVVGRDVMIVGGAIAIAAKGRQVIIAPLFLSRINTLLQIALIALILLIAAFGLQKPAPWVAALLVCITATTLASGALYCRNAIRDRSW